MLHQSKDFSGQSSQQVGAAVEEVARSNGKAHGEQLQTMSSTISSRMVVRPGVQLPGALTLHQSKELAGQSLHRRALLEQLVRLDQQDQLAHLEQLALRVQLGRMVPLERLGQQARLEQQEHRVLEPRGQQLQRSHLQLQISRKKLEASRLLRVFFYTGWYCLTRLGFGFTIVMRQGLRTLREL